MQISGELSRRAGVLPAFPALFLYPLAGALAIPSKQLFIGNNVFLKSFFCFAYN